VKKVIEIESPDVAEWDALVREHPWGRICHLSAWRQALESSFGHIKGHFLSFKEDRSERITGGIAVYAVRSRLLGNRIVSVPFAPLSDPLISSPEDLDLLLPHLIRLARQANASRIEIRASRAASLLHDPRLGKSTFYKHHYLLLDRTLEEIRRSFSRTAVRQVLSKAHGGGFEIEQGKAVLALEAFYALFTQSRRRLGLPPIPYRFFFSLWEVFGRSDHLSLLFARHRGDIIGGVLSLKFKDTFALEYSADLDKYRKLGVVQFLYWEAIKLAFEQGFKIFSFGRTASSNRSLIEYKEHWGTEVEDLPVFVFPETMSHRATHRELSTGYRVFRKLTSLLPPRLHQLLGEIFYRNMG